MRSGTAIARMRPRATIAAVALGVLVAGCGQQQSQRQAVATYLTRVNRVESELAHPLATVTSTGSQFAQEQRAGGTLTNLVPASNERALLGAWTQIMALRARLAAIPPPPPAARLQGLLLQIVDGQAQLTHEVAELVDFLPRYSAALGPLAPATRSLEAALAANTSSGSSGVAAYASKAAALRQFKDAVDAVLAHLRPLNPPSVSKPGYERQVQALQGMSASAGQLAGALAGGGQASVQQLLESFDRAAASNQTLAAQKAQIAAVRAYDDQSTRLAQLSQAAQQERLRLADTLS